MYYLIHVDYDANNANNELFMVVDQSTTPDTFIFDITKRIMEQTFKQNKYNYRNDIRIYRYTSIREAIERNPAAEIMVSSNINDIMNIQTQSDDVVLNELREKYKIFIASK